MYLLTLNNYKIIKYAQLIVCHLYVNGAIKNKVHLRPFPDYLLNLCAHGQIPSISSKILCCFLPRVIPYLGFPVLPPSLFSVV